MENSVNKKSILVISDDSEFINNFKKNVNTTNEYLFFENNKFYLLNSDINNFDLIIFDDSKNHLNKFVEVFNLTKSYNFNIPMILLLDGGTEDLVLYKKANVYAIYEKNIKFELLIKNIDMSFNFLNSNKKVQFENGYYFDLSREELFHDKKIIKLTRIEKKLVKLLTENANNLVTYEQISDVVWKGKVFSIYSLRNVIKHIREKTNESFIKNSSNRGYILNGV